MNSSFSHKDTHSHVNVSDGKSRRCVDVDVERGRISKLAELRKKETEKVMCSQFERSDSRMRHVASVSCIATEVRSKVNLYSLRSTLSRASGNFEISSSRPRPRPPPSLHPPYFTDEVLGLF